MRMPSDQQRQLERIRYWQGQNLRSADFRSQVATDLQLRWWHNRAMHSAYGVAFGYQSSPYPATGTLLGVDLGPGVAYDCFGRPLILPHQQRVQLPPKPPSSKITLLARYRENWDYPDPRQTDGVCISCCQDSLAAEHPEFVWTSNDPPDPRAGVALVRISVGATALTVDDDFEIVTSAPLAGPYLANGSTVPGSTPWSTWRRGQTPLGLQTDVDTSAAGFQQTPCYFAWLELSDPTYRATGAIFTHITRIRPDGFRFRILATTVSAVGLVALEVNERFAPPPYYVCWLGCESQAGVSRCLKPEVRKSCCS
ncbi:MAG TPA: hypothetical protein VMR62_02720 [Bryobacteraceae bacterium]|nr:hypothetical protein [Bryobacteraceae bacterium]